MGQQQSSQIQDPSTVVHTAPKLHVILALQHILHSALSSPQTRSLDLAPLPLSLYLFSPSDNLLLLALYEALDYDVPITDDLISQISREYSPIVSLALKRNTINECIVSAPPIIDVFSSDTASAMSQRVSTLHDTITKYNIINESIYNNDLEHAEDITSELVSSLSTLLQTSHNCPLLISAIQYWNTIRDESKVEEHDNIQQYRSILYDILSHSPLSFALTVQPSPSTTTTTTTTDPQQSSTPPSSLPPLTTGILSLPMLLTALCKQGPTYTHLSVLVRLAPPFEDDHDTTPSSSSSPRVFPDLNQPSSQIQKHFPFDTPRLPAGPDMSILAFPSRLFVYNMHSSAINVISRIIPTLSSSLHLLTVATSKAAASSMASSSNTTTSSSSSNNPAHHSDTESHHISSLDPIQRLHHAMRCVFSHLHACLWLLLTPTLHTLPFPRSYSPYISPDKLEYIHALDAATNITSTTTTTTTTTMTAGPKLHYMWVLGKYYPVPDTLPKVSTATTTAITTTARSDTNPSQPTSSSSSSSSPSPQNNQQTAITQSKVVDSISSSQPQPPLTSIPPSSSPPSTASLPVAPSHTLTSFVNQQTSPSQSLDILSTLSNPDSYSGVYHIEHTPPQSRIAGQQQGQQQPPRPTSSHQARHQGLGMTHTLVPSSSSLINQSFQIWLTSSSLPLLSQLVLQSPHILDYDIFTLLTTAALLSLEESSVLALTSDDTSDTSQDSNASSPSTVLPLSLLPSSISSHIASSTKFCSHYQQISKTLVFRGTLSLPLILFDTTPFLTTTLSYLGPIVAASQSNTKFALMYGNQTNHVTLGKAIWDKAFASINNTNTNIHNNNSTGSLHAMNETGDTSSSSSSSLETFINSDNDTNTNDDNNNNNHNIQPQPSQQIVEHVPFDFNLISTAPLGLVQIIATRLAELPPTLTIPPLLMLSYTGHLCLDPTLFTPQYYTKLKTYIVYQLVLFFGALTNSTISLSSTQATSHHILADTSQGKAPPPRTWTFQLVAAKPYNPVTPSSSSSPIPTPWPMLPQFGHMSFTITLSLEPRISPSPSLTSSPLLSPSPPPSHLHVSRQHYDLIEIVHDQLHISAGPLSLHLPIFHSLLPTIHASLKPPSLSSLLGSSPTDLVKLSDFSSRLHQAMTSHLTTTVSLLTVVNAGSSQITASQSTIAIPTYPSLANLYAAINNAKQISQQHPPSSPQSQVHYTPYPLSSSLYWPTLNLPTSIHLSNLVNHISSAMMVVDK